MNPQSVPAIIRVRRKRTAVPSHGWAIAAKKAKNEDENDNAELSAASPGANNSEAVFQLAATADKPSISTISGIELPPKVAIVEYDLAKGIFSAPSVVDREKEHFEETLNMVESMDVTDSSGDSKNKAPLASNESLDDEQYVYDFYYQNPNLFKSKQVDFLGGCTVRNVTEEELLMFMDENSEESEPADDDPDSNDENDFRNDYPDEEDHNTTSSDDYDHYGDEDEVYTEYLDEYG